MRQRETGKMTLNLRAAVVATALLIAFGAVPAERLE
jgi:hypothetical protein